jgi:broad specificity polyphosphatase/5'/3'-nucleotidase SurE
LGVSRWALVKEIAARRLEVYVVAPKYQVSDAGKSNSRTVRAERVEAEGARLALRD